MDEGFVIETRELSKRYGERIVAVDRLALRVRRGEVYGFLGPNGAGKTTTLRMLLDLSRPTSGRGLIFGKRYRDLPAPERLPEQLDGSGVRVEQPGEQAHRGRLAGAVRAEEAVDHAARDGEVEAVESPLRGIPVPPEEDAEVPP